MNVDVKPTCRVELEYTVNSTASIIFKRLSTPHGLSEWFANDVNLQGNVFTFIWDNATRKAELVEQQENRLVKFRWIDSDNSPHLTFMLQRDDITEELSLMVTEEIEDDDEAEAAISLWNHQIGELKRVIGA